MSHRYSLTKYNIGLIVAILIITAAFAYLWPFPKYHTNYLKDNAYYFDLNNTHTFDDLNYSFNEKNLILVGESHATTFNYQFKLKFFQYLLANYNISTFLDEIGFSVSCITMKSFQNFSLYLNYIFNEIAGTLAATTQNLQFYQELSTFLNTIPNLSFFTYLGIDLEHQYPLSVLCLDLIYQSYNTSLAFSNEIYQMRQELESYEFKPELFPATLLPEIRSLISNISEQLFVSPSSFSWLNQEDLASVKFLIKNTMNTFAFYDLLAQDEQTAAFNLREKALVENFQYFDSLLNSKYFGFWGNAHVLQSPLHLLNYDDSFATQLSNLDKYRSKILSFLIYYKDSMQFNPFAQTTQILTIQNFPPFRSGLDISDFPKMGNSMIPLDRENSPFKSKFLLLSKPLNQSTVTTDYFQILIVVDKSLACSPIET